MTEDGSDFSDHDQTTTKISNYFATKREKTEIRRLCPAHVWIVKVYNFYKEN